MTNKRNESCLLLLFLGLLFFPLPSLSMGETNKARLKLERVEVESSFSVIDGNIIPQKPDQETCDADNAYMLSALEQRRISLMPYDYRVEVSKEVYTNLPANDREAVVLYHYKTAFIDFDYVKQNVFPMLSDEQLTTTSISASEIPTTCYAFLSVQTLNLVCHYGLKQAGEMTDTIEELLQERLQNAETPKPRPSF